MTYIEHDNIVKIFEEYFELLKDKSLEDIREFHNNQTNLDNLCLTVDMIKTYSGIKTLWYSEKSNVFIMAAGKNNFNLVKYYWEDELFNFNINYHNNVGHSVHKLAIREGNYEMIKFLEAIPELNIKTAISSRIFSCEERGSDAFLFAACYGHLEIMKYLIDKYDWDINVENEYEMTAYQLAAQKGHLHIIKFFDELDDPGNNNIKYCECDGMNPYLSAAQSGHFHIIKYFDSKYDDNLSYISDVDGMNGYLYAAGTGNLEMVKYFEDKYENSFYEYKDDLGSNAYMLAATCSWDCVRKNKEKTIKLLEYFDSKYSNNIDYTNYYGKTAFFCAVSSTSIVIMDYFTKHYKSKININKQDTDGDTVYMSATLQGFVKTLEYLDKAYNVNLDIINNDGCSAFDIAENREDQEMVKHFNEKKLKRMFKPDNKIEITYKCNICMDKIKKDDLCCMCCNYHVIHYECYSEYLIESNLEKIIKNTKCIYCRDDMLRKTIKYEDIHI